MCRRVFNDHKAHRVPVRHACGKCIPCRINAARDTVIRIITELKRHKSATFCTYTYSDDYVPKDGFLVKKHMQDMIKRLRKQLKFSIKVFYIGEYGDLFGRPHYHAIIFGLAYNSPVLRKPFIWPFGFSSFKAVIPARVRYISQYTVKKLKDDMNGNEKPTFSCRSKGFGDNLLQVDPAVCDRGYIQYDGQNIVCRRIIKNMVI